MSARALHLRITPGGSWQRLLPGVYVAVTGTVTQSQREMAALLYAGPRSIITGVTAVRRHHLRSPGPEAVDVLIPGPADGKAPRSSESAEPGDCRRRCT